MFLPMRSEESQQPALPVAVQARNAASKALNQRFL